MFTTIRDHQSATVKARGEMNSGARNGRAALRKSGSWSYSSSKRHVIAKVMELPFAEDVGQLARRVGLMYSTSATTATRVGDEMMPDTMMMAMSEEQQLNHMLSLMPMPEATNEQVFVRIDDYLSKQVRFEEIFSSSSSSCLNDFDRK